MCHRPRLWEKAAPLTSQQLPCARPGQAGKQEPPAAQAPGTLPSARSRPAPTLSQSTAGTREGLPLPWARPTAGKQREGAAQHRPLLPFIFWGERSSIFGLSRLVLLDGTVFKHGPHLEKRLEGPWLEKQEGRPSPLGMSDISTFLVPCQVP